MHTVTEPGHRTYVNNMWFYFNKIINVFQHPGGLIAKIPINFDVFVGNFKETHTHTPGYSKRVEMSKQGETALRRSKTRVRRGKKTMRRGKKTLRRGKKTIRRS